MTMSYREIQPEEITGNPFEKIGKEWMLITAEKEGRINTMTASWGGLGVLWRKNVAFVFVRPQRYTKEFVDAAGRCTLSFYGKEYRKALAYFGSISGRDEDKIGTMGFTPRDFGGAPAFEQAQLVLRCKTLYAQPLDPEYFLPGVSCDEENYPNRDYHTVYVMEIEAVYEKE